MSVFRPTSAILAVLLVLMGALLSACAEQSGEEDVAQHESTSPAATFADGLSPRDILDRSEEADAAVQSVKARVETESTGLDGSTSREVYEALFADGDEYYLKYVEGSNENAELLFVGGKLYTRESQNQSWKVNSQLAKSMSSISDIKNGIRGDAAATATESSSGLDRLSDESLHGQRMLRVAYQGRQNGDEVRRKYEDYLKGLRDQGVMDQNVPEFPDELIPDELVITGEIWIGADDFHMHRLMMTSRALRDGETITESSRVFDSWDHNQPVPLPDPTSTSLRQ